MTALEMAIERLRPLVNTAAWEFCIIWTIGDDPSRFILWKGCCCCGGDGGDGGEHGGGGGRYLEKGKEQLFLPRCRDNGIQHPIRTEACKELAKFPLFIPLYSGVHGEVIMSNQARWHLSNNNSVSDTTIGTQALVPVVGGLVELCTRKLVPRDEKTINFIRAQCVSDEQVSMATREPFCSSLYDPLNILSSGLNFTSSHHLSYEGSSTVSDPSDNQQQLRLGLGPGRVSYDMSQEKSSGRCPGNNSDSLNSKRKQDVDDYDSTVVHILDSEARGKRGNGCSKNLLTERKRRKKNKELQYALRALVPNITKMHTAATLGDAIDYIKELQTSVQKYEDELREIVEDESTTTNIEANGSGDDKEDVKLATQINGNQGHSMLDEKKETNVEIEVHQIRSGEFLVRITCSKRKGVFLQLMEAMDVSGLQIVDVNVTTCNALLLTILRVEAKREIHLETLKDVLIKCMQ